MPQKNATDMAVRQSSTDTSSSINVDKEKEIIKGAISAARDNNAYESVKAQGGAEPPSKDDKHIKDGKGQRKPNQSKPDNQKPNKSSGIRATLEKYKAQVSAYQEAERTRKESTPSFRIRDNTMEMVYTGKVAGKSATRCVEIIKDPNIRELASILNPIMSAMNTALKGKSLEEKILRDDSNKPIKEGDEPIYEATPLTKARFAYATLLRNPEFVSLIKEVNQKAEEIFRNIGIFPKDLQNVKYSKDRDGVSTPSPYEDLMAQVEYENSLRTEEDEDQDSNQGLG